MIKDRLGNVNNIYRSFKRKEMGFEEQLCFRNCDLQYLVI